MFLDLTCGHTNFIGTGESFSYINYPNSYIDNLDCYHYITVSEDKYAAITLDDFETESCCDYVEVRFVDYLANFFDCVKFSVA